MGPDIFGTSKARDFSYEEYLWWHGKKLGQGDVA